MTEPAKWKIDLVKQIKDDIKKSPVTALVSIKGIRNIQLQQIRRNLKGQARLRVTRGTLISKSLDGIKKDNISKLKEHLSGQVALLTTEMQPAMLYSSLEKTRQKAPARGGETAMEDIIIEAKETQFPPGPMISEFQKVGLQTAIEKGKIAIKKETVFVKKGEKISRDKAKILEKLEILPLEVGLDIITAYQDGLIYGREAMMITSEYLSIEISSAFSKAKALASSILFIIKENANDLIIRGEIEAEALAIETNFLEEKEKGSLIIGNSAKEIGEKTEAHKEKGKNEDKKEQESKSQEPQDATEGFGALFG